MADTRHFKTGTIPANARVYRERTGLGVLKCLVIVLNTLLTIIYNLYPHPSTRLIVVDIASFCDAAL